jgi:hypothetical protein
MAKSTTEDAVDGGATLVQKMLSAVTGSVLTSLLGMYSVNFRFSHFEFPWARPVAFCSSPPLLTGPPSDPDKHSKFRNTESFFNIEG